MCDLSRIRGVCSVNVTPGSCLGVGSISAKNAGTLWPSVTGNVTGKRFRQKNGT